MELRYCDECGDGIRVEGPAAFELSGSFVCDRCRQGTPRTAASPTAGDPAQDKVEAESLNFFSNKTIALHRQRKEGGQPADARPKSGRLRLVKGEAAAQGGNHPAAQASTPPAPGGGQRLVFRCPHCRQALSIRPVDKTSKLTCPHCQQVAFVTSAGQIAKSLHITPATTASASGSNPPLPSVGSVRLNTSPVTEPRSEPANRAKLCLENPRQKSTEAPAATGASAKLVNQDPDKTDFIPGEAARAIHGKSAAVKPIPAPLVPCVEPSPRGAKATMPQATEEDLLQEALEVASTLSGPGQAPAAPKPAPGAPPAKGIGKSGSAGITKRVFKALLEP